MVEFLSTIEVVDALYEAGMQALVENTQLEIFLYSVVLFKTDGTLSAFFSGKGDMKYRGKP